MGPIAAAAATAPPRSLRGAPKAEIDLVRLLRAAARSEGEARPPAVLDVRAQQERDAAAEALRARYARLAACAVRARELLAEVGGAAFGGAKGTPAAIGDAALASYAAQVADLEGAAAALQRAQTEMEAEAEAREREEERGRLESVEEAPGPSDESAGDESAQEALEPAQSKAGSMSLRAAEALATQEKLQEGLTDELVALAASLKSNALEVDSAVQRQSRVLDDTETAVGKSLEGTKGANARAAEVFAEGWGASCQGLVLTLLVLAIFTAVFLFMRFAPNLDSRHGEL